MSSKLITTESDPPTSFDPLDSDNSNNLHASQMVHRSILEVGLDNSLTSTVLKDFSYNPQTAEIVFVVGETATFSDGTPVTASDVATSILRMALNRPNFPVLKHIRGIGAWIQHPQPLSQPLEGVTVTSSAVHIQLEKNVLNPLFRFALPLFGVVKRECVDLATGHLDPNCPTSGPYTIKERSERSIVFTSRTNLREALLAPQDIELIFEKGAVDQTLLKEAGPSTAIITLENRKEDSGRGGEELKHFIRQEQPQSRFSAFLLSGKGIFEDRICRYTFAQELRKSITQSDHFTHMNSSIFTKLLPGHVSQADLEAAVEIPAAEIQRCLTSLQGRPLRFAGTPGNLSERFLEGLKQTAERLAMTLQIDSDTNRQKIFASFIAGESDILLGGSGFWPFDPVGDIQMLFTPGLHKPLTFVTQDPHLQALLDGLEFLPDPGPRLAELNKYLFSEALINVFAHSKRVYLTRGQNVVSSIPIAITPPAPWQIFTK